MYRAKRQLCSNVLIVITWIPWRADWLVVAVKGHYCNITIDSLIDFSALDSDGPNERCEQIELSCPRRSECTRGRVQFYEIVL